jgi:hypothetical protein
LDYLLLILPIHLGEEPILKMAWIQPEDWEQRILFEPVTDGIAIITNNFESNDNKNIPLSSKIQEFIKNTNEMSTHKISTGIPASVYIMACLKHNSPLPPEFWRNTLFKEADS